MTHEGSIEHVKDGIYTTGRRAKCSCGWCAPDVRDTHARALRDQFAHVTDQETPVPPPHTPAPTHPDDIDGGDDW